ncbi:uncharacterized protein LOC107633369 [Arachis ipaensis]|uniref:uncharacterized protein LOC107633369 n=1 Tax=Arachis ipaensis TaxID=130454 RepID=UPI0007AF10D7|nr:uncharacterized protein LOC107633369 [Arachis ipaensis]
MPLYAKFIKKLLSKKKSLEGGQTVVMTKECSAIIQRTLPMKKKDLGSFHIPCTIENITIEKSLCDLGANINLMPLSLMKKLQIHELKFTQIALQMVDKSIKQALGVVENVLMKVGKFFLPADFVILDMEEDCNTYIILGILFLATGKVLIDVERGELMLRVHDEHLVFNVFRNLQVLTQEKECIEIDDGDPKEATKESLPEFLSPCLKEKKEAEETPRAQGVKETKDDPQANLQL